MRSYQAIGLMDKKKLSETDIRTKYITPAIVDAGWDLHAQLLEEVTLTKGQIQPRGNKCKRGKPKFADYILFHKPNIPIAVVEAKDNNHALGDGMQQALDYSEMLACGSGEDRQPLPFVFSSNGDGFLFHDTPIKGVGDK